MTRDPRPRCDPRGKVRCEEGGEGGKRKRECVSVCECV